MKQIEQAITSIEVAKMVEKEHSKLLKDIRRYQEQLNEAKIGLVDFFKVHIKTQKVKKGHVTMSQRKDANLSLTNNGIRKEKHSYPD